MGKKCETMKFLGIQNSHSGALLTLSSLATSTTWPTFPGMPLKNLRLGPVVFSSLQSSRKIQPCAGTPNTQKGLFPFLFDADTRKIWDETLPTAQLSRMQHSSLGIWHQQLVIISSFACTTASCMGFLISSKCSVFTWNRWYIHAALLASIFHETNCSQSFHHVPSMVGWLQLNVQ